MNRLSAIGRLTRKPEMKQTSKGAKYVQYTLACKRRIQSEGKQDTDFLPCVAWSKLAELMDMYLDKGSLIAVDGHVQTRQYKTVKGETRYVTEIITESIDFLDTKKTKEEAKETAKSEKAIPKNDNTGPIESYYSQPEMTDLDCIPDEDLPF